MKQNYNFIFLIFVIVLSSSWVRAQDQIGEEISNLTSSAPFPGNPNAPWSNGLVVSTFEILDSPLVDVGCDNPFNFSSAYRTSTIEYPSSNNKSFWPTLPGGPGMQQFTARIQWKVWKSYYVYRFYEPDWDVYINGELCTECYTEVVNESGVVSCGGTPTQLVTVHYPSADVYDTDGEWEFALRPHLTSAWNCNEECCNWTCTSYCQIGFDGNTTIADNVFPEIRFSAIMAGVSFTEVLGTFTTPQTLTCILRDPPGDLSYSTWGESTSQCFGSTFFSSTETEESSYIKVKYGFGVPGVFDAEIEGTLSASMTETNSETNEVMTCVEAISTYSTNTTGPPDDLFIGNAILYNYGMASTISREGCVVTKTHGLAMAPLSQVSSFTYPESEIRGSIIPQLEAILDIFSPGTIQYEDNLAQLEVWEQALAMNDEIKAEAQSANVPAELFVSGGAETFTLATTTTESKIIDMKVRLSAGIDASLTVDLPWGGGVEANYQFNIRTEYGQSEFSSIEYSNITSYYMSDDDAGLNGGNDNFSVNILQDKVFGTFVFALDETVSSTSCPYEGGIPIEQPQLWIGSNGQSTMTLENVPIGEAANFPILVCNNHPTRTVSYLLSADPFTVNDNASVTAFSTNLISNDITQPIPFNQCQSGTLVVTQFDQNILDYEDIEISLSSGCGDDIESTVLISAHFSSSVGVDDANDSSAMQLYPNPNKGQFTLRFDEVTEEGSISISDISGKIAFQSYLQPGQSQIDINATDLAKGMYIIQARSGDRLMSRKMVID